VNEGLFLGLAIGGLIWLVMWRAGVRPRPWREILVYEALGLALWLVFKASGAFDPGTSIFLGFVTAAIVLTLWTRLAKRPT